MLAVGAGYLTGVKLGLAALAAGGLASVLTIWRELRLVDGVEHFLRLWQLGRWLMGESLLYGLTTYGIWVLVVPKAGYAVAGELRAGQQLFAPVQTILIGFNTVLLGHFARQREFSSSSGFKMGFLQAGLLGAWGMLLVIPGPHIVNLLFGPGFRIPRIDLGVLTMALMAGTIFELSALRLRAARYGRPLIVARAMASAVALSGTALIGASFVGVATSLLVSSLVGAWLTNGGLVHPKNHAPIIGS
jgi:hypothetical protein